MLAQPTVKMPRRERWRQEYGGLKIEQVLTGGNRNRHADPGCGSGESLRINQFLPTRTIRVAVAHFAIGLRLW